MILSFILFIDSYFWTRLDMLLLAYVMQYVVL